MYEQDAPTAIPPWAPELFVLIHSGCGAYSSWQRHRHIFLSLSSSLRLLIISSLPAFHYIGVRYDSVVMTATHPRMSCDISENRDYTREA